MEVLFKISVVLSLSSASFGLRVAPAISFNSPIGLDFGISNVKSPDSQPKTGLEQCFCFPYESNLGSVINILDATNESIERVVVYLYKTRGRVAVYIPNENKQKWFPDLYFDDSEGDILAPVSKELLVDIFDDDFFNRGQTVVTISQEIETKEEDTNQSEQVTETDDITYEINLPVDFVSVETEQDTSLDADKISFDNTWQPINENEYEAVPYPLNGGILNLPNAEKLVVMPLPEPLDQPATSSATSSSISPISSTITPVPSTIPPISSTVPPVSTTIPPVSSTISPVTSTTTPISPTITPVKLLNPVPVDIQDSDMIPGLQSYSTVNIMTPVSLDLQSAGNKDQDKLKLNNLESIDINLQTTDTDMPTPNNFDSIDTSISNLDDYEELQQVISISPAVPQSPVSQNLYSADIVTSYITFEKWFELQLKRIVLYNLESQSQILELRERVKKILLDNGMQLSINGIVSDVNGIIVQMSNIKLRPILIGAPSDPYSYVNTLESVVSYVQLLEVISSVPPKLLGTLVMGTVYLPRNLYGQKAKVLNEIQNVNAPKGCTTCNSQSLPFTSTGIPYPTIGYENYDGWPFRRNFRKKNGPVSTARVSNVPYDKHGIVVLKPQRIKATGKSALGSIFDGLFGNLGVTPGAVFDPTRRLLTGGPKGPKPGPQHYPNDDLPGFRIVGGNAATSSGPPLANKGRSGFRPSNLS